MEGVQDWRSQRVSMGQALRNRVCIAREALVFHNDPFTSTHKQSTTPA